MRPIKFRAWNGNKICKVESLSFSMNNSDDGYVTYEDGSYNRILSFPIMQFTGLKDKNDKEIWEGDIVRIQHPDDKGGDFGNTIGRVFWLDEEGAFYHGNSSGRPPKRMWEYCEVLGNIYENKELL